MRRHLAASSSDTAFAHILLGLLVLPITSIFTGFTLSILWGWFVVPLGVMALSIPQSLGISITIAFLTHQPHKSDDEVGFWATIAQGVIKCVLFLALGWIYHCFM